MNISTHIKSPKVKSSETNDPSSNRLQTEKSTTAKHPKKSRNLRLSIINDLVIFEYRLQIPRENFFTVSKFRSLFLNRFLIIFMKVIKTTKKVKGRVNVMMDQKLE